MPTTDYTEFLHNVKQEFITNSYELDGTFIFDIELPVTPHICPKCGETTERIKDYRKSTTRTINWKIQTTSIYLPSL